MPVNSREYGILNFELAQVNWIQQSSEYFEFTERQYVGNSNVNTIHYALKKNSVWKKNRIDTRHTWNLLQHYRSPVFHKMNEFGQDEADLARMTRFADFFFCFLRILS